MKRIKRTISLLISVIMIVSLFPNITNTARAISVTDEAVISVSDLIQAYEDDTGEKVETQRIYFQMPNGDRGPIGEDGNRVSSWENEYNDIDGTHYPAIYWWGGTLACDSWVGYRMEPEDPDQGIFYADVPLDVNVVIFNNGVDGGTDPDAPIYSKGCQSVDTNVEGAYEGDYDSLPYGSPDTESFNGCIFIVDPDQVSENMFSGKKTCGGNWYVYYGNGCYGQEYAAGHDDSDYPDGTPDWSDNIEDVCMNPDHYSGTLHFGYIPKPTEVNTVIAVGNGSENYLHNISWDPADTVNSMTQVAEGVYELTMEDISAGDNYTVKFAINSVDDNGNRTSYPWQYNLGTAKEMIYPTGETINLINDGRNCHFKVDNDNSIVTFRLDLRSFDLKTFSGAKLTILVDPAPVESTYYVSGSFTDSQFDSRYILRRNMEAEGIEYVLKDVALKYGDSFMVVETNDSIEGFQPVWYPSGDGTGFVVDKRDIYDIYFRPNYDGGISWYKKCLYIEESPEFFNIMIADTANGSVSASVNNVAAKTAHFRDTVTLTVTPDEGYAVKSVKCNDTTIKPVNGVYSFNMPYDDVTITAEFMSKMLVSLSLSGDIGINFLMLLDPEIAASKTAYMQFTIPTGDTTETKTVWVSEAERKGDYHVFKCHVAAKEMTSQIKAQIIDGDSLGTEYTYSVKDYADYLLAHVDDNEAYAQAAPLVKAMLNYGTSAQNLFDRNTDRPANASLSDEDKIVPDVTAEKIGKPYDSTGTVLPDGVTFTGTTLSLKSETTLSLYFTSANALTFSCEGQTVDVEHRGTTWIARIRGIAAWNLGDDFTLNVSDGTTDGSVTYTPTTYCYNVLTKGTDDANLTAMVKALYHYRKAAEAYAALWED